MNMQNETPQKIHVGRGTSFSSQMQGNQNQRNFGQQMQQHQNMRPITSQFSRQDDTLRVGAKKATAIFDWLITISIAALFFGLPLFFTGLTFQGVIFEKQIYFYFWILLALVCWASKGVITGEMRIKRTALDIPIVIFWLLYALSTALSIDRWHSLWGFFGDPSRGLLGITGIIIAYYLILSHFDSSRAKWIIASMTTANAIVSIWTLLGLLGIKFLPQNLIDIAPLSLVGSIIGLGIYFSTMIPIIVAVMIKSRTEEEKPGKLYQIKVISLFLLVLLNLFILLMIYSFNPWLGVLVGVSVFLVFILSQIVRPADSLIWVPMLVFVAILSILMIGKNNLARINLPVEASPSYKLSWDVAKSGVMDKFFTGSGPATYGYVFSKFKTQEFNLNSLYSLKFYQGTGIIFEALPTIGAIGTIALIVIILSFVSIGVYMLARDKEKNKLYALGFFAATLVLLVDAVTNRVEGTMLIYGALIATVALGMLYKESDMEGKLLNLSLKASPKFALALAFVFMVVSAGVVFLFVFVGKVYVADIYMRKAAIASQPSEEGSVQQMVRAINLYGKEGRYYTSAGQQYMALFNMEAMKEEKNRDANLLQRYLNNSIALASKGGERMKNDVAAIEMLAQIYENAGLYVADSVTFSEDNYKKAQELDPQNPNYFVKLGQLKIAEAAKKSTEAEKKALIEEAKRLFDQSIEKKPNFSAGYYQLSLTQDALGDKDKSIENMSKAFGLERNNVNYAFSLAKLYQSRGKEEDMKMAEVLYKQIIAANDKEINAHFNLGLLYEKQKKKNEATAAYEKVSELLPETGSEETKKQIQKMISNVEAGIENTPESLGITTQQNNKQEPAQDVQTPQAPQQ